MDNFEPVKAWAVVRGNGRVAEASIYRRHLEIEVTNNNIAAGNRGEKQDYRVVPVTIIPTKEIDNG